MKRKDLSLIAGIALCTLTVLLTVVYLMRPEPIEAPIYVPPCDTNKAAADAVRAVTENGYMSLSVIDGTPYFHPDQAVLRGEFAVILNALLSLDGTDYANAAIGIADEKSIPESQRLSVRAAVSEGYLLLHNDYTFRHTDALTREEAANVLGSLCHVAVSTGRIDEISDLNEISPHFRKNAETLIELGIMQGADGMFRPKDAITREELALVIHRILQSEFFSSK